jgi:hypothetical protein
MAFQTSDTPDTSARLWALDAFLSPRFDFGAAVTNPLSAIVSALTDLPIFHLGTPVAGSSINGTNMDDTLIGGSGADTLSGGIGHDHLVGGAGNDQLILGDVSRGDIVAGGSGTDTLTLRPNDLATGQQTYQITAARGGGLDISGAQVSGVEHLEVGGGLLGDHITVTGNLSASGLAKDGYAITFTNNGQATIDVSGMTSSDIGVAFYGAFRSSFSHFDGGGGDDYFYLGSREGALANGHGGDDTFQFTSFHATVAFTQGSGHDTVEGFRPEAGAGQVLDLSAYGFHDLAQVLHAATSAAGGQDTIIHLGGHNDITLVGVQTASLNAGDFLFAG